MNNLLDEEEVTQNRFRGKEKEVIELLSRVNLSQRLLFLIIGIIILNVIIGFVLFDDMNNIILQLTTGVLFFTLSKRLKSYPIGVMVLGMIVYLFFYVPQLSSITNLVLGVVTVFLFILGIVNGIWIRNKKRELGLE